MMNRLETFDVKPIIDYTHGCLILSKGPPSPIIFGIANLHILSMKGLKIVEVKPSQPYINCILRT